MNITSPQTFLTPPWLCTPPLSLKCKCLRGGPGQMCAEEACPSPLLKMKDTHECHVLPGGWQTCHFTLAMPVKDADVDSREWGCSFPSNFRILSRDHFIPSTKEDGDVDGGLPTSGSPGGSAPHGFPGLSQPLQALLEISGKVSAGGERALVFGTASCLLHGAGTA